jgi:hypothetical protein
MTRRTEITLPDIKRHWPHHVALSADKVRGVVNSQIVWSFTETLSAAPRPYSLRRDDGEFVVFCFTKPRERVLPALRWGAFAEDLAAMTLSANNAGCWSSSSSNGFRSLRCCTNDFALSQQQQLPRLARRHRSRTGLNGIGRVPQLPKARPPKT